MGPDISGSLLFRLELLQMFLGEAHWLCTWITCSSVKKARGTPSTDSAYQEICGNQPAKSHVVCKARETGKHKCGLFTYLNWS